MALKRTRSLENMVFDFFSPSFIDNEDSKSDSFACSSPARADRPVLHHERRKNRRFPERDSAYVLEDLKDDVLPNAS
jgi:hypothetical protein